MKTTLLPKISYTTSKDEILLEFRPVNSKPEIKGKRFKLWSDNKGNICAIAVTSFTKGIKEFRKQLTAVKLGGIWRDVEITEQDIRETREELLKKLEERDKERHNSTVC